MEVRQLFRAKSPLVDRREVRDSNTLILGLVESFSIFPLPLLLELNLEISWHAQADSSPVRTGAILYRDIPVLDKRQEVS
jgi:hypothetical protein